MRNVFRAYWCRLRHTGGNRAWFARQCRLHRLGTVASLMAYLFLAGWTHTSAAAWQAHPDFQGQVADMQVLGREAAQAYGEQDWSKALELYQQILHEAPESMRAQYRSGVCLLELDRYAESAEVFKKCLEFPSARRNSLYNLAAALCQLGDLEESLKALEQAVDDGYVHRIPIEDDDNLKPLGDDTRFQRLVDVHRKSMKAAAEAAKGPTPGLAPMSPGRTPAKVAVDWEEVRRLSPLSGSWILVDSSGEPNGTCEVQLDDDEGIYQQVLSLDGAREFHIRYRFDPVSKVWVLDISGPKELDGKLAGEIQEDQLMAVGRTYSTDGRADSTLKLSLEGNDKFVINLAFANVGGTYELVIAAIRNQDAAEIADVPAEKVPTEKALTEKAPTEESPDKSDDSSR